MFDFYGTCRQHIAWTWILWDFFQHQTFVHRNSQVIWNFWMAGGKPNQGVEAWWLMWFTPPLKLNHLFETPKFGKTLTQGEDLELQTTSFLWLFQLDDSKSLHKKWLLYQTSIKKWWFRVPGSSFFNHPFLSRGELLLLWGGEVFSLPEINNSFWETLVGRLFSQNGKLSKHKLVYAWIMEYNQSHQCYKNFRGIVYAFVGEPPISSIITSSEFCTFKSSQA